MVSIEIENGKGEFLTVQRAIAGDRHKHLMTVYEGRAITKKEGLSSARDYFVREPYAASSDLGFHRRLKDFIGWGFCRWHRGSMSRNALCIWKPFSPCFMSSKDGLGPASRTLPHMARNQRCRAEDRRVRAWA